MTLTRQARVLLRRLGAPKGLEYAAAAAMFYHALFITAVVWVKTASNAVFLAGSDPQNLPFLYMGSALVVAGASIALARPLAKYSALVVARRILPVISILVALAAFATTLRCLAVWDFFTWSAKASRRWSPFFFGRRFQRFSMSVRASY